MIQFTKLEPLVFNILSKKPETRHSDRRLMLEVWRTQGFTMTDEQISLWFKCYQPESIRRTRQTLKNRGYFTNEQEQFKLQKLAEDHRQYHQKQNKIDKKISLEKYFPKKISEATKNKWEEVRKKLKVEK